MSYFLRTDDGILIGKIDNRASGMMMNQLKSAKKHFYKQTKRLGLAPTPEELAYITRLKAEIILRRA